MQIETDEQDRCVGRSIGSHPHLVEDVDVEARIIRSKVVDKARSSGVSTILL